MRFALIHSNRVEAKPKLKALCPYCSQSVIAKCGEHRIWHWAHHNKKDCDKWWEAETEWHRTWKNNFPDEWQEICLTDEQTGEKHIADIRTGQNLVIEFQHSYITSEERISREKFYGNMVWVVDGTRLKKDSSRFLKGKYNFQIEKEGIFAVDSPEKYFPVNWLGSSVPVIFDFRSNELADEHKDIKNHLYCLFPERVEGDTILAEITFKAFINATINGEWSSRVYHCINNVAQLRQERKIAGELKLQQDRKAWEEYLGEDIEYRKSFR